MDIDGYRWITAQSSPSTKTNILRIQNHPCFEERIGSSYEKYAGQRLSHCSSAVFWERLCSDSRNEMGSQVDLLWVSQPRDGCKQRTVWKIQFLFVRETFWRLHVESTGWNLNFKIYYKSYEPVNWERDMIRQVAKWIFVMKYSLPFSIQLWFHFIENSCHSTVMLRICLPAIINCNGKST